MMTQLLNHTLMSLLGTHLHRLKQSPSDWPSHVGGRGQAKHLANTCRPIQLATEQSLLQQSAAEVNVSLT